MGLDCATLSEPRRQLGAALRHEIGVGIGIAHGFAPFGAIGSTVSNVAFRLAMPKPVLVPGVKNTPRRIDHVISTREV
jgi:hypothetical protein